MVRYSDSADGPAARHRMHIKKPLRRKVGTIEADVVCSMCTSPTAEGSSLRVTTGMIRFKYPSSKSPGRWPKRYNALWMNLSAPPLSIPVLYRKTVYFTTGKCRWPRPLRRATISRHQGARRKASEFGVIGLPIWRCQRSGCGIRHQRL